MDAPSEKSADKLMKKAEKYLRPSMMSMRLKPAWDDAYPMFEKAAEQYKVLGLNQKAQIAYEKAAEANLRGGGTAWHAAKHLEAAAKLACEAGDYGRAKEFVRQAAENYVNAGKIATGAEALGRGAQMIAATDPAAAAALYEEAVELYSKDGLASCAGDIVARGVVLTTQKALWHEAAELLLKWGAICAAGSSNDLLCRAYLGVIVIHLYAGDAQAAWASYQDFLDVEGFSSSTEAHASEALFSTYASGSAELIRQRVSQQRCFLALDNAVARLAKQLPAKGTKLDSMADFLRGVMGDQDAAGPSDPLDDDDEDLT